MLSLRTAPLPLFQTARKLISGKISSPRLPSLLNECDRTGVKLPLFSSFYQSLSLCLLCSKNKIVMMEYCANAQTSSMYMSLQNAVTGLPGLQPIPDRLQLLRRNVGRHGNQSCSSGSWGWQGNGDSRFRKYGIQYWDTTQKKCV